MISMIVAHDLNRGIGYDNKLLCNLKDDMKLFQKYTTGKPIIMGRKTFESIGKALPNRRNIILTKDKNYKVDERDNKITAILGDFESIILYDNINKLDKIDTEIVVIGGASIYEQFLPYIDRLYVTEIQNTFDKVDSYFPKVNLDDFKLTHMEYHIKDDNNESGFAFKIYDKYNK